VRRTGAALSLATALLALTAVLLVPAASPAPLSPRALISGLAAIPASYLTWYKQAARTCPGLHWEILAGIGTIESDNGRSQARGVHHGKNRKGAEGPMQFEPATFAEYAVRADPSARLTPYNPQDAIFTAARMLCADGGGSARGLRGAVFAYNHAHWYVRAVLAIAARYTAAYTAATRGIHHSGCWRPGRHRGHRRWRHRGHRRWFHRGHRLHPRGGRPRGGYGRCG
jgi:hypothetical protein